MPDEARQDVLDFSILGDKIKQLMTDIGALSKELDDTKQGIARLSAGHNEEKVKLKEIIEQKTDRLNELQDEFEQANRRIEKLLSPPNVFGYFLRFDDQSTADIIMQDGRLKRVSIDPNVENKLLKTGIPLVL